MHRIALILRTLSSLDPNRAVVYLTNVDTDQPLQVPQVMFLLTLEHEPGASFVRGHLQRLDTHVRFPIQCDIALFEALKHYISSAEANDHP